MPACQRCANALQLVEPVANLVQGLEVLNLPDNSMGQRQCILSGPGWNVSRDPAVSYRCAMVSPQEMMSHDGAGMARVGAGAAMLATEQMRGRSCASLVSPPTRVTWLDACRHPSSGVRRCA